MSDYIQPLFEPLTMIIILIIIIVWIFKRDKNLVTLLWIGWTFLWIVSWLHWIQPDNISESIPELLWGLYTAFYTSIAWIVTSISISFYEWFIAKENVNNDDSVVLSKLLSEIESLNKNIWWDSDNSLVNQIKLSRNDLNENHKEMKSTFDDFVKWNSQTMGTIFSEIESLNKWIWWDWDNSLINQIKLSRGDLNENHREMKKAFDDFAEDMTKNNTEALFKAVEKVMNDFSAKINDQLWQSFKELTYAIDNLLVWQNEYKENIISTKNALDKSSDSLEKSSNAFEITVQKSEAFAEVSSKLENELQTLNSSLEIFKNGINEFDWVANKTKEMADSMIKSIDSLTENFVSKAETMIWETENHIKNMKDSFLEQSNDLKNTNKEVLENMVREVENTNKASSESFQNMNEDLRKQVLEFDEKLWEELNKSLRTLWEQLTALSWKFVSDYWRLAEKLESLVTTSNR